MGDPKLTPALNRSVPKQTLADRPAVKPAAVKAEAPATLSSKTRERMGGADYLTKSQPALTPRPPIPPPSTERLALDDAGRMSLAATCQVNAVSVKQGNSSDICGGAAVVAALLLRSTSPEAARANAGALRAAFNASPIKALTPVEVQSHVATALKNFEEGTLSEEDACYLQQAAYVVGRGVPQEGNSPGLSTGGMAAMVADLVGYGATLDQETSFVQISNGGIGHWVGTSGTTAFNSASTDWPVAFVDVQKITTGSRDFSGRVRILRDKLGAHVVQAQTRFGSDSKAKIKEPAKKGGWQAEVTPLNPRDPLMLNRDWSNASRLFKSLKQVDVLRD